MFVLTIQLLFVFLHNKFHTIVIYYVQVIVTFVIIQKIKILIFTQCELYVKKYNLRLKEYKNNSIRIPDIICI